MAQPIISGRPTIVNQGTLDNSLANQPPSILPIARHLPKIPVFTQRGPSGPQLVDASVRDAIYGTESFTLGSNYFNHGSELANLMNERNSSVILERLVAPDALTSELVISISLVASATVQPYLRDTNGNVLTYTDNLGNTTLATTTVTNGYDVELFVEDASTAATNNVAAGRYELYRIPASSVGAFGNNVGISIVPLTGTQAPSDITDINGTINSFPYAFSINERINASTTPNILRTINNGVNTTFVTKPGSNRGFTGSSLNLETNLTTNYNNTTDGTKPVSYSPIGQVVVNQANIDTVLGLLHSSELAFNAANSIGLSGTYTDATGTIINVTGPAIATYSDIIPGQTNIHMFNLFTFLNTSGSVYHTVNILPTTAHFGRAGVHYLLGGTDGTFQGTNTAVGVSETYYDTMAYDLFIQYNDTQSHLTDIVLNPESVFYDTGFSMRTKLAMTNALVIRKDTNVVLSTYISNGAVTNAIGDQISRGNSLSVALRGILDSEVFDTGNFRGSIVLGTLDTPTRLDNTTKALTYDIAAKVSDYMGDASGRYLSGLAFDTAPNSVISTGSNIQPVFISEIDKQGLYNAGVNYPEKFDRNSYSFQVLQTAYINTLSVLNDLILSFTIADLNKHANTTHKQFTGSSGISTNQLSANIVDFMRSRVEGLYDNRYIITPVVESTPDDVTRGYSITTYYTIESYRATTVHTTRTEAYLISSTI